MNGDTGATTVKKAPAQTTNMNGGMTQTTTMGSGMTQTTTMGGGMKKRKLRKLLQNADAEGAPRRGLRGVKRPRIADCQFQATGCPT